MNLNGNGAAAPASPLGTMTPGIGFALAFVQDTGNAPVQAAYGGNRLSSPFNVGTLTATWTKVAGTWGPVVTAPLNVVQDTANQGIRVSVAGVFLVTVRLAATFTASTANATRDLQFRFFDETDNVPIGDLGSISVVKDQDSVSGTGTVMVEFGASLVGKLIVLQISAPVNFAALNITSGNLTAARVSIN